MPRFVTWMFSLGLMISCADAVFAQTTSTGSGQAYPAKPIRIIATEVGGTNDLTARQIAQGISGPLGQQVIVDNRSAIAIESVAKAAPDGYTLLVYGTPLWLLPFMRENVPWDPVRDFSPISLAVTTPSVVVVHPSLPVRSMQDLIAFAKARAGMLNYSSGSAGSVAHLTGALFNYMARVDIVRIPYKGSGPALTALVGGQVQVSFPTVGAASPHIKSGRLRALAVTSAQPSALAPGLPTVAAAGLPGYESVSPFGVFAPAGTPPPIIGRLNEETVRALNKPEVKQRFFDFGVETVASSPEEFAAALKSEMAKWGKVIKEAGIRDE